MLSITPLAYSEDLDEVQGFDVSVDRALGTGHRPGLHPVAPAPPTGTGTVVGGAERFARSGDAERPVVADLGLAQRIGLTERDVTVLRFLADGWTTAEIAHELAYAESTIKKEVHLIVHHLGARNRTHAVAMAVRGAVV